MEIIKLENINHEYITFRKKEGLKGSLQDFFKRNYEKKKALESINITIQKGEFIGLLGPNGAGKTTLMKIISGLIKPSSGDIHVLNQKPFKKSSAYLKQLGMVLGQKSQLAWDLPAIDTLLVLKEIYGISQEKYKQRLDDLLSLLNITDHLHTPVRKLSLGERMKFELTASLLHSPSLLLLDEPTIGLDVSSQRAIRGFLKLINEQEGTTILLTSHYARDIEELANRLIILKEGTISYDGSLPALLNEGSQLKTLRVELSCGMPLTEYGYRMAGNHIWEKNIQQEELNVCIQKLMELKCHLVNISTLDIPLEEKLYSLFSNDGDQYEL